MLDAHAVKSLAMAGAKSGFKGAALVFAIWIAISERMDRQDAIIAAQTARMAELNDKVAVAARLEVRVLRLEESVYGQYQRNAERWMQSHEAWMRKQGIDVSDAPVDGATTQGAVTYEEDEHTRRTQTRRDRGDYPLH